MVEALTLTLALPTTLASNPVTSHPVKSVSSVSLLPYENEMTEFLSHYDEVHTAIEHALT